MEGLRVGGVELKGKMLGDIGVSDLDSFGKLGEEGKGGLGWEKVLVEEGVGGSLERSVKVDG